MAQPVYERTIDQYFWWVEQGDIGIAYVSNKDNKVYSPETAATVKIQYVKKATPVDVESTDLDLVNGDIPSQFHEGIVAYVLQKSYERTPEGVQLAQYFKRSYDDIIKDAKAFVSKNHTHGSGRLYVDKTLGLR
jgi:hypothetical protein